MALNLFDSASLSELISAGTAILDGFKSGAKAKVSLDAGGYTYYVVLSSYTIFKCSDDKYVIVDSDNEVTVQTATQMADNVRSALLPAVRPNFESFEVNCMYEEDTAVNPLYTVTEENYLVGNDTMVLGNNNVGAAEYSIIQGDDVVVDSKSSNINVAGSGTVIAKSSNVVGSVSNLLLVDADDCVIGGSGTFGVPSAIETMYETLNAVSPTKRGITGLLNTGNNRIGTQASNVSIHGDGNKIGYWSQFITADAGEPLPPFSDDKCDNGNGSIYGDYNRIGVGTVGYSVIGNGSYIPSGSKNIHVIGDDFNVYRYWNNYTGAKLPFTYASDEQPEVIAKADFDKTKQGSFTIIGRGSVNDGEIVLDAKGISAYISSTGTAVFDCRTATTTYESYPASQSNIFAVGDRNTLRLSGSKNVFMVGDDLLFSRAKVTNSLFFDNGLQFNTDVCDIAIDQVFWIGDHVAKDSGNFISGINTSTTNAVHSYSKALVFTDKYLSGGPFYGVFGKPTDFGFTSDNFEKATKPNTPMIYTGGIALGGAPAEDITGTETTHNSDYGILKLGSSYLQTGDVRDLPNFGKLTGEGYNMYLRAGTDVCPYAGMPLAILPKQEWDGTFRIKAAKLDRRGLDIDDVASALQGKVGGVRTSFGISAYIGTNTDITDAERTKLKFNTVYEAGSTTTISHYTLEPQDGWIYNIGVSCSYDTTTQKLSGQVKLSKPTADDVGKQFIIYIKSSTYVYSNDGPTVIEYKGISMSTAPSPSCKNVPGSTDDYTCYMTQMLPAGFYGNDTGLTDIRGLFNDTDIAGVTDVNGSDVAIHNNSEYGGHTSNGGVYGAQFTIIRVPKFKDTASRAGFAYIHLAENDDGTEADGWDYCYQVTSLGQQYFHKVTT